MESDKIGDMTRAELRNFIVNLVLSDPATQQPDELPPNPVPGSLLSVMPSGIKWLSGMQLIETQTNGGSGAPFTFSNIPQHFRHLLFLTSVWENTAGSIGTVIYRPNGDSGANYDYVYIIGAAGAASSANVGSTTFIHGADTYGAGAQVQGSNWAFLSNYAKQGILKTMWCMGGVSLGGASDRIQLTHGIYGNAPGLNPITSMVVNGFTSGQLVGTVSLYGIS